MRRIFLFVLLMIFIFSLIQTGLVSADVYMPSPVNDCHDNEEYFQEGTINQSDYEKIRSVVFGADDFYFFNENPKDQKGFCIDRKEYCSKNNCNLLITLRRVGSVGFHTKNIIVNLILNAILIFLIYLVTRTGLRVFYKVGSLIRVIIITILGYFADFIAISLSIITVEILEKIGLANTVTWYKLSFEQFVTQPLILILTVLITFILVFLIFYNLYSKIITLSRRKRIILSLAFGFLSNPIWYILYKLLSTS